jgi:hypothetical protein
MITKASCRKVQLKMQCYKWDAINNFGINHLSPRSFNFISYFTTLFKVEMHPSRKFILATVQSAQTMSLNWCLCGMLLNHGPTVLSQKVVSKTCFTGAKKKELWWTDGCTISKHGMTSVMLSC